MNEDSRKWNKKWLPKEDNNLWTNDPRNTSLWSLTLSNSCKPTNAESKDKKQERERRKVDRVFANHYLSSTASLKELPTFPSLAVVIFLSSARYLSFLLLNSPSHGIFSFSLPILHFLNNFSFFFNFCISLSFSHFQNLD